MKWEHVTIFISSTFNDMHAERDYLVKNVFPELRDWCEEHKIHLVDVDLRWGVTTKDSENKNTVGTCLKNIDKCRPFFLCFLGQRRGWMPDPTEDISENTEATYPDIRDKVENKSITEIEIEHALLSPMYRFVEESKTSCPPVKHSLFFFREYNYADKINLSQRCIYTNSCEESPEKTDEKLEEFKEKIRNKGKNAKIANEKLEDLINEKEKIVPQILEIKKEIKDLKEEMLYLKVNSYCGVWDKGYIVPELKHMEQEESIGGFVDFQVEGVALKNVIIDQLKEEIAIAFPENMEIEGITELQRELDQQDLFREINTQGFISKEENFKQLDNFIYNDNNAICYLIAEAGLGKTMLLANYSTILKERIETGNEDFNLFVRFCGVSDKSGEQYSIWRNILEEAKIALPENKNDLNDWIPNEEELKKNIGDIFEKLTEKRKTIIIIDGINQLNNGLDMVKWLPDNIPNNLKVILSFKKEDTEENKNLIKAIKSNESSTNLEIKKLESDEDKKSIINKYLEQFLKALDNKQINKICKIDGSDNPLLLKILLNELKGHGQYETLEEQIANFPSDPQKAFQKILERLESEETYTKIDSGEIVKLIFGLLATARYGLSEEELIESINIYQKENNKEEFPEDDLKDVIRLNLRQVKPFMKRSDRRYDYFYDSFKLAAKKYKSIFINGTEIKDTDWHDCLAKALYNFRPGECTYHARKADNRDYLSLIYKDLDFLNRYYQSEGAYSLKSESNLVAQEIIPDEIMQFINDTAVMIENHPEVAPATFYKELSSSFKASAEKLCVAPWICIDEIDTGIKENRTESVKPTTIEIENINCGSIAENKKEAFLFTTQNLMKIINMDSMQNISTFEIEMELPVEKIFCNADGQILVTVMKGCFSVYKLQRDNTGAVFSSSLLMTKNCQRIHFIGTLAFADGNKLFYQAPEKTVHSLLLCDSLEEQLIDNNENVLSGYFQKQHDYLVYKISEGYNLTCMDSDKTLLIDSLINDICHFNDKLLVFPNNRYMLICDPLKLDIEERIELDFVPKSVVSFNDGVLLSDEHGAIYTWYPKNELKSHGMLAVEWDRNPKMYYNNINKAFYYSNNRYAVLSNVETFESLIMQATIKDGKAEMLLLNNNKDFYFQRNNLMVKLTNPFQNNLYGMTALLNYKCAWNPNGDILSMENDKIAVLSLADGTQKEIMEPSSLATIISIHWVNGMDSFVILYSNGDIHIVKTSGRIIKTSTFQSSSGNYLICGCGKYFSVFTKRRLVQAATTFEEEVLSIIDNDGHIIYDNHFQGIGREIFNYIVYDDSQKKLYLISKSGASVLNMSDQFTTNEITFDNLFHGKSIGLVARNGILYYINLKGDICAIDLNTGKQIANMPLHRNVSLLQSSYAGNNVVLIENNEKVYNVKLNLLEVKND